MQTNFRGRDFIGDLDFTKEEVETILDVAWDLKRKRALGEPHALLRDKALAMLFFFTSTRTRGSFEAHLSIAKQPKSHTVIPPKKSVKSLGAISMALRYVSVTGSLAISTSMMLPKPVAYRSLTCSAMSIIPSNALRTS